MTSSDVEHSYGNPEAPVCITEFGDFECPYCAGAAPVLRELIDTSDGGLRLIFKNFPLFEVHPHALTAALAAESTGYSGGEAAYWKMHDKLFAHQARLTDIDLKLYAEAAGGDPELAAGPAAQQFAPIVQADYAAGLAAGVAATPTLFIDGLAYEGRIEVGALRRATAGTAGTASAGGRTAMAGAMRAESSTGAEPDQSHRDAPESRRRPWQRR
jgi:protein-disulfide isomerase